MDRKAASKHLARFGLTVQAPNKADSLSKKYLDEGVGALAVTAGLCCAYRITSAFSPRKGQWIIQRINEDLALQQAVAEAAFAHPLKK